MKAVLWRMALWCAPLVAMHGCATAPAPRGNEAPVAIADVLVVSPDGNDANPGTSSRPLATVQRALALMRQRTASGAPAGEVLLADGRHRVAEPLVIDAALSGTPAHPFTLRALPGAAPVLSGARRLQLDWQVDATGLWSAPLPGPAIDALFVDGQRQVRARYPNVDPAVAIFDGFAADATAAQRVATWKAPAGGVLHGMHPARWGDVHFLILGKKADGTLDLGPGIGNNRGSEISDTWRYVENIREELDAPHEWFHDTAEGRLYFMAPAGVDPRTALVEAPITDSLLRIVGSEADPVHDVSVRGLTLTQTTETFLHTDEPLLRSDWMIHRGGAVFIEGAARIEIADDTLRGLGGNAIFVSGHTRGIGIRRNEITEVGASGIAFVGRPEAVRSPLFAYQQRLPLDQIDKTPGPRSDAYPADSIAEDNLIHRTGRIEKQSAGVQIAMAARITVAHNSIYEVPRAGINIGDGTWGGHLIAFNDVFDTVLETSDHGAFNSWGRDRYWHPDYGEMARRTAADPSLAFLDAVEPVVLRNNRFRCDHGWDIDLDDGATNYVIENNLLLHGGLKNREGFRRIDRNNILVDNTFHPHVWFAASGDRFEHNIVMRAYAPIALHGWGEAVDHNLFTDAAALRAAQARGQDIHSLAGRPGFVDAAAGNFALAPDALALKVGFQPFALDAFGVQTPRLKAKARQPEVAPPVAEAMVIEPLSWFAGARVKSVQTLGEQSAAGLPEASGVLILKLPADSDAARGGLQVRDAIVAAVVDGQAVTVRTAAELRAAVAAERRRGKLVLTVVRNQAPRTVTVSLPKP